MLDYQKSFLDFAIQEKVIQFGKFTLKSGRQSPYFFNSGLFNTGKTLAQLGSFYASALYNSGIKFDLLFGPAYKGIPLVTATSIAIANQHQLSVPWCFNRKEAKDHGEGGHIVGAPLEGKTVIVDDVITAGTAVREVMQIMEGSKADPVAILTALDRQEKTVDGRSAIKDIEQQFNIPVINIITFEQIQEYVFNNESLKSHREAIVNYREIYGITPSSH